MTTEIRREVTLHVPITDNSGADVRASARLVLDALAYNHGGCTYHEARGMWYGADTREPRRYDDDLYVVRVAVKTELEGVNAMHAVKRFCRDIGELALYWVDVHGVARVEGVK